MISEISPSREQRLALILQAIEDLEREKDDYNATFKDRMQRLKTQLWQLRTDILSGQLTLVTEPIPEEPKAS